MHPCVEVLLQLRLEGNDKIECIIVVDLVYISVTTTKKSRFLESGTYISVVFDSKDPFDLKRIHFRVSKKTYRFVSHCFSPVAVICAFQTLLTSFRNE